MGQRHAKRRQIWGGQGRELPLSGTCLFELEKLDLTHVCSQVGEKCDSKCGTYERLVTPGMVTPGLLTPGSTPGLLTPGSTPGWTDDVSCVPVIPTQSHDTNCTAAETRGKRDCCNEAGEACNYIHEPTQNALSDEESDSEPDSELLEDLATNFSSNHPALRGIISRNLERLQPRSPDLFQAEINRQKFENRYGHTRMQRITLTMNSKKEVAKPPEIRESEKLPITDQVSRLNFDWLTDAETESFGATSLKLVMRHDTVFECED